MRFYQLTIIVLLLCIGYLLHKSSAESPHRYVSTFNALENPSPSIRWPVIHELLTSIDYPLPNINPPTRLVIGMLLSDEDATVRQHAAMTLTLFVSLNGKELDEATVRRIVVAVSRAMAEDPNADCRYICAFCLEDSVIGRVHLSPETVRACKPYWIKASHAADNYIPDMAQDMLAHDYQKL